MENLIPIDTFFPRHFFDLVTKKTGLLERKLLFHSGDAGPADARRTDASLSVKLNHWINSKDVGYNVDGQAG